MLDASLRSPRSDASERADLAGVADVFSRTVVGWSMSETLHTQLVLDALDMALWRLKPQLLVVHRSDHDTPCTLLTFTRPLWEAAVAPSMGSRGDASDNALCVMACPGGLHVFSARATVRSPMVSIKGRNDLYL